MSACSNTRKALLDVELDGHPLPEFAQEHLDACVDCQRVRGAMNDQLAVLRTTEPAPPGAAEEQWQLTRALGAVQAPVKRPLLRPSVAFSSALAMAALGLALWIWRPWREEASTVRSGQLASQGHSLKSGDRLANATSYQATVESELQLRDGTWVSIAEQTQFVLSESRASNFELHSGRLRLTVKPQPADAPLTITTPEARVRVVGTRFSVEREKDLAKTAVSVEEGTVEVLQMATHQTSLLHAGDTLNVEMRSASDVADAGAESPPERTEEAEPATVADAGAEHSSSAPTIAEIRRRIHLGDVRAAREQIRRARKALHHRDRAALAELAIVEVEADVAEGKIQLAVKGYQTLTRKFRGTAAADAAAFAAAQLVLDHVSVARGGEQLRDYLRNFPKGRYREEATQLLVALGARDGG